MKNSKRIILSTYDDITNPHYGGGGAQAMHQVAKHLAKHHSVVVISWNHSGKKNEFIDGVSYQRIGSKVISPKVAMFLFQFLVVIEFLTKNFDVWIESFGPPFTTSFLPVFRKKPVIGITHMLSAEDMLRKYSIDVHFIENYGIKQYKHIIATNKVIAKKVSDIAPKSKITVISNGIEKPQIIRTKKKNQLLYIGRIEVNQKGLDLLIKAFELFSKKSTEIFTLVIAGTGTDEEITKLKTLINASAVREQITLMGKVVGRQKSRLLSESKVLVVPSRFETHSIVAMEGISYGLPIVCFDINGLRWIPKQVSISVESFDIVKFSLALLKATRTMVNSQNLKKYQEKFINMYTWDKVTHQYNTLISTL